jgi:hypothetical protein
MPTMLASLLVPYSLQLAVVVVALWALLRMFAPRAAAVRLRAWQAALAFAVVLPAVVFLPVLPAPAGNGEALLSIAGVSVEQGIAPQRRRRGPHGS